jgi:small-conductance mechanosensitive channel
VKPELWQTLAVIAGTAAGAGAVAWVVARIVRRLGRREPVLLTLHQLCARPFVGTVVAVATLVALQGLPDVSEGWRRFAGISVIAFATWLVVNALLAAERLILLRLPVDVADNRRARRMRTQVAMMRRITGAVVVLLGVAAALMSFPHLRTFGASLLASAGLAGILAGLAAQTMLGNVFAGLQLAFADALRIDDVVVVEGEWGRVEEITLTYVVIHIWDERRLVLPTSYFTTTPFQNWTRTHARVVGAVMLHLDYATPVEALREQARRVIEASPLWDRRDWVLQVVDTTEATMVVRVLASAHDGPSAWDLRCDVREALLTWLRDNHPESLPKQRTLLGGSAVLGNGDGVIHASDGVPASLAR